MTDDNRDTMELLPCPFCGGTPKEYREGTHMPYMTSLVRCKCKAEVGCHGHGAKEIWNTRTVPDKDRALWQEMRKTLNNIKKLNDEREGCRYVSEEVDNAIALIDARLGVGE